MELNKDLISSIASIYGVTAEDLTAKLTSDTPQELKLAGQLFTEDELKARDSGKYNEGKEAESEMITKSLKKKYAYDFEGKNIDSFMSHHEEQLKAKYSKNSNERVTELEKDIDKLKNSYTEEIETYKGQIQDLSGKYQKQSNKNYLLGIMPKDTVLKPEALITLFNSEYELSEENGVRMIKKNGEVLKDPKTTSPIEPNSVFNDWLVKEKYISGTPGRGGGNEFGNNNFTDVKTPDQFQSKWAKENPDLETTSPKYQEDYAAWREIQKKSA